MSGSELHEISAAIGELREAHKQSKEDRERLERKLDRVLDQVASVRRDFEAARNRGIGIIIAFGFLGSVLGAKMAPWLHKIFPAAIFVAAAIGAARAAL